LKTQDFLIKIPNSKIIIIICIIFLSFHPLTVNIIMPNSRKCQLCGSNNTGINSKEYNQSFSKIYKVRFSQIRQWCAFEVGMVFPCLLKAELSKEDKRDINNIKICPSCTSDEEINKRTIQLFNNMKEFNLLKGKQGYYKNLEKQVKVSALSNSKLLNSNKNLNIKYAELQVYFDSCIKRKKEVEKEMEILRSGYNSIKEENNNLQNRIENTLLDSKDVKEDLKEARLSIDNLETELHNEREENKNITGELEQQKKQISDLIFELKFNKQTLKQQEGIVNELNVSLREQREQNDQLKATIINLEAQNNTLSLENFRKARKSKTRRTNQKFNGFVDHTTCLYCGDKFSKKEIVNNKGTERLQLSSQKEKRTSLLQRCGLQEIDLDANKKGQYYFHSACIRPTDDCKIEERKNGTRNSRISPNDVKNLPSNDHYRLVQISKATLKANQPVNMVTPSPQKKVFKNMTKLADTVHKYKFQGERLNFETSTKLSFETFKNDDMYATKIRCFTGFESISDFEAFFRLYDKLVRNAILFTIYLFYCFTYVSLAF